MTMATTDSKLDIINSAACRKKKNQKQKTTKHLVFSPGISEDSSVMQ